MVRLLTRVDALVFGYSLRSFQRRVEAVRNTTGVDILCNERWKLDRFLQDYPIDSEAVASLKDAAIERPSLESPLNTISASTAATAKNVLPMLPLGQNTAVAIPTSFYHMQNGCLERTLTCIQRG